MSLCRKYGGPVCDEDEEPANRRQGGPPRPEHCDLCNCNVWNPQQHERWHRYADS